MSDRPQRRLDQEALRNLLQEEGLDCRTTAHSHILTCPVCGKDKWAVRKSDGFSKCYHCGPEWLGYIDTLLARTLKRAREELSELLYGFAAPAGTLGLAESDLVDHWNEFSNDAEDEVVIDRPRWPDELLWPPDFYEMDARQAELGRAYLEGRGVDLALAQQYGLRYHPATSRVVFPVIVEGVLRGWQKRYIHKTEFMNPEGKSIAVPKVLTDGAVGGSVLMFQDRLAGSDHGIMVEGGMDAMKCHRCGGNTATMGKGVTPVQLSLYLKHYRLKRLYVGLDPDAADDVARIVREASTCGGNVELYWLEPAAGREDLGDGTLDENYEQFRRAKRINLTTRFSYRNPPPTF